MALPLIIFLVLLWFGWEELGVKGVHSCPGFFAGLLLGCATLSASPSR